MCATGQRDRLASVLESSQEKGRSDWPTEWKGGVSGQ